MTYRERREARAERLQGWAAKREQRAAAVFKAGELLVLAAVLVPVLRSAGNRRELTTSVADAWRGE